MKLWFRLICGFYPLNFPSHMRISDSLGFSLSVLLCFRTGYCIYTQSALLVTEKPNTCRCAGPSLYERNRTGLCPLTIYLFFWHFLMLCLWFLSGFLSSRSDIDHWITNFGRIQKTERSHSLYFLRQKFVRRFSEVMR